MSKYLAWKPPAVISRLLLVSSLQTIEKDIQKESKSAKDMEKKVANANEKIADIKAKLEKLDFSPDEYDRLDQEQSSLRESITGLKDRIDDLSAQLSAKLTFSYQDPCKGFDRSKVKGRVANLIKVKDAKFATALEVVAGAKLSNVVVDDHVTGKAILDRGKLEREVTILPLNVIKEHRLSEKVLQQARSIASSMNATASPAISLLDFDEEVRSAIEHIFGKSIIVDSPEAANAICDATKTRTVTLQGDVYDPSGVISGGSSGQIGTTLTRILELSSTNEQLAAMEERLQTVSSQFKEMASTSSKYDKLASQLELAEADLSSAEHQLSLTKYGIMVERRDAVTTELKAAEEERLAMETEMEEQMKLHEELKAREAELTQKREEKLAGMEKAMKEAKRAVAEKAEMTQQVSKR